MILYYAVGGGLGHLTRTLAILSHLSDLKSELRVVASSHLAAPTIRYFPCPIDLIPEALLSARADYYAWLEAYLKQHRVRLLLLDTFPWGIIGEWRDIGRQIPRILLARYLKWEPYLQRVSHRLGPVPFRSLILEPLEKPYLEMLAAESDQRELPHPIVFAPGDGEKYGPRLQKWLIIHSGSVEEREALIQWTGSLMREKGEGQWGYDTLFPEQGIFPADSILKNYSRIVCGGGYNMAGQAVLATPDQQYFLQPFSRRFDDQALRVNRIEQGLWQPAKNGALKAAEWVRQAISARP